jgi:hypothetical protein
MRTLIMDVVDVVLEETKKGKEVRYLIPENEYD